MLINGILLEIDFAHIVFHFEHIIWISNYCNYQFIWWFFEWFQLSSKTCKGYGNSVLSNLRSKNNDLILGRDFSGTVMDVGMTASNEYRIGDEVWGATFPSSQGSHADFVTASTFTIAKVCV